MALNLKQWLAGLFGLMLVLALAQGGLALVKLDAVAARTTLLLDDTIPSVTRTIEFPSPVRKAL